jgi:hypothetical protein
VGEVDLCVKNGVRSYPGGDTSADVIVKVLGTPTGPVQRDHLTLPGCKDCAAKPVYGTTVNANSIKLQDGIVVMIKGANGKLESRFLNIIKCSHGYDAASRSHGRIIAVREWMYGNTWAKPPVIGSPSKKWQRVAYTVGNARGDGTDFYIWRAPGDETSAAPAGAGAARAAAAEAGAGAAGADDEVQLVEPAEPRAGAAAGAAAGSAAGAGAGAAAGAGDAPEEGAAPAHKRPRKE